MDCTIKIKIMAKVTIDGSTCKNIKITSKDGERHLITPAQYEGVKNLSDNPDAPENTKISE